MFVSVDIQTIALLLPLATSPKHDACYWASLLFGSFDRDRELGDGGEGKRAGEGVSIDSYRLIRCPRELNI